jgi:hypothetical protein
MLVRPKFIGSEFLESISWLKVESATPYHVVLHYLIGHLSTYGYPLAGVPIDE